MDKSAGTRRRIIEAASRKMFRYGIRSLTMDDLALELAVSKRTIYEIFHNKRGLIREVIGDLFHQAADEGDSINMTDISPIEKLARIMAVVYRVASNIDPIFIEEVSRFYPDIWEVIDKLRRERLQFLIKIVNQGIEQGEFRPMDSQILADFLISSITGFITPANLVNLGITPRDAMYMIFSILFTGLVRDDKREELHKTIESIFADISSRNESAAGAPMSEISGKEWA